MINLEYLSGEPDPEYDRIAEPYQKEIDFAFFAANFGYSRADYDALTLREKAFLYKAWENRVVADTTQIYNAAFTAVYNALRKKGKPALKLWKRGRTHKADVEEMQENQKIAAEIAAEDKSWVDLIYRKNGMKRPERRRHA